MSQHDDRSAVQMVVVSRKAIRRAKDCEGAQEVERNQATKKGKRRARMISTT